MQATVALLDEVSILSGPLFRDVKLIGKKFASIPLVGSFKLASGGEKQLFRI